MFSLTGRKSSRSSTLPEDFLTNFDKEQEPILTTGEHMDLITRKKDFSGCHTEIQAALEQGMEVMCKVEGISPFDVWITDYCGGEYVSEGLRYYQKEDVTPCYKGVRVKSAVEIMKWLVEKGYKVDSDGNWRELNGHSIFRSSLWQFCGEKPKFPHSWHPDLLEEVTE